MNTSHSLPTAQSIINSKMLSWPSVLGWPTLCFASESHCFHLLSWHNVLFYIVIWLTPPTTPRTPLLLSSAKHPGIWLPLDSTVLKSSVYLSASQGEHEFSQGRDHATQLITYFLKPDSVTKYTLDRTWNASPQLSPSQRKETRNSYNRKQLSSFDKFEWYVFHLVNGPKQTKIAFLLSIYKSY